MTRSTAQQLADYERRYRELAAQLADIGYIRAGSLALRPQPLRQTQLPLPRRRLSRVSWKLRWRSPT